MTSGFKTTEFWVAQITSVLAVFLAILVQKGVIGADEESLYKELVMALAPLVIAVIQVSYIYSRTAVKSEYYKAEAGRLNGYK